MGEECFLVIGVGGGFLRIYNLENLSTLSGLDKLSFIGGYLFLIEMRQSEHKIDRIIITSNTGFRTIMLDDVVSIKSNGSYALFYTISNNDHLCTKPLSYYVD